MAIDLSECHAKIERAREHSESLEAIVDPIYSMEADFIQLNAQLDVQSDQHIFFVAAIEEWRLLRMAIILGDVVHNLRSALDYLFWQLYCHHIRIPKTKREANGVQFPLEDGSKRLADKRVHFGKIPSTQWAVIEDTQPYKRGNRSARSFKALRDLSNRDKHRALNPLLLAPFMFDIWRSSIDLSRATTPWDYSHASDTLEIGAEVVRMGLPEDTNFYVEVAGY